MAYWSCPLAGALLLSLALALAAASAPGEAAAFENLGTFIGRGGAMSRLVGPGPDGSERLYVAYTYISSMDLVAYDRETGKHRVWRSEEGGAWAMETDRKGRLYIGTYFNGHLLRLDPKTDQLEDLGQVVPGETYIWQLSLAPDGTLYGCTYPGAKLLRFDPETGKTEDLGRVDPDDKYNRSLFAAADGWIYCGTGSETSDLVAYNPKTKELRTLIPAEEQRPGFGQVQRGADGTACGTYHGMHYRLHDGAAEPIPSLPPLQDRTRYRDGTAAAEPETYPGRNLPIFRVAAGPDGKIYGSSILPEYLLRFDPADGKLTTMGLIPGAEAYSMLAAHGKLYIASYTGATLQIYDPGKPFNPGTKRSNNPSYYGSTAPDQNRPYDMALGPDGKAYIACVPGYGIVGGALSWYDPATDRLDHVPTPVKDHSVASVCGLPDGLLAVGTSIEAGSGARSRAKEAVLFLWDPARQEKVWEGVPIPGATILSNLALGGDGLLYASAGHDLFAFDPKTRRVVSRTTLPQGAVVRAGLLTLEDGRVIGLTKSSAMVLRYASARWAEEEFGRSERPLDVGKAAVGGWLYAASGDRLLRCRIPGKR